MSTTINDIQNLVNQNISDSSTDSVSASDRLQSITTAVQGLYSQIGFDFTNRTYDFNYFDTLNYYNITTDVPDFLDIVDLRREKDDHTENFIRKSPRELAVEIAGGATEPSIAIERKNRKNYLAINYTPKYGAITIHECDSLTSDGTWEVDTTNSDALNLTLDESEYKEGSGCLNFDIDVSQSGNNRATVMISTTPFSTIDFSDEEDLASLLFRVYIPDSTYTSSITGYWGQDSTGYWSASVTTDAFGESFSDGWNRVLINWIDSTKTGTPSAALTKYLRIDVNYSASQGDDTDYRIDDILMVRPEELTLHYQSWYIGVTSTGSAITEFAATTDVPYYSGIYDFVNPYVAYTASATLLRQVGEEDKAKKQEILATKEFNRLRQRVPSSKLSITRNFKPHGLSW